MVIKFNYFFINMNSKHLAAGSEEIPIQKGILRMYSTRFCPYAHRILLVLSAKNVDYDIVNIHLRSKPEWYLKKSPGAKVPIICIDGENLCESRIIAEFLEERYPQYQLYPKDPLKKAMDKIVIEMFGKIIMVYDKMFFSPKLDISLLESLLCEMDYFEKQLALRGTQFFSGNKPGMIDYMIWPWCERLESFRFVGGEQFRVPRDRFQRMWDWSKAMLEDEPVKKCYLTPEIYCKFYQSLNSGAPEYDLLAPK